MARHLLAIVAVATVATATTLPAQIPLSEYAARREALGQLAGDGAIVVLGAGEPLRDYETFSPAPHLRYLSGWTAPNAALLLTRSNGVQRAMLFIAERNPSQEVWTGPRASLADAQRLSGLPARDISEFTRTVDSVLATRVPLRVVGEFKGQYAPMGEAISGDKVFMDDLARRHPDAVITDANRLVQQLRATKSAAEVGLLQKAIDITVRAHEEAMRMVAPGWNEFEVQALVEYVFRRNGAERPSFTTIAGSGDNATTLHYWQNDRVMNAGELMVMDIGASYGGYSADVTRTLPLNGRFTPAQRDIYTLVRRAQVAGEQGTRIGQPQRGSHLAASDTLARGLTALGLIDAPAAMYDCDASGTRLCPQLRLYFMHGLGHGIGLEVHDPDLSDGGAWTAGSVVTIEPGVYVRRNLAEVLPDTPRNRAFLGRIGPALARYGGIGVRIEDDYLLTTTGLEWLSKLPREVDEVEAALQAPRATAPQPRDARLVEQYRRSLP
ncbi:MAG: Xaa-Pro aminopeptidase [Gemmatimonadaceae bacterium]|nr:Xaa-Pro aminopeptidase [Gemmatimonadaceae bacterium]